jgi:hypothetical protein
VAQSKILLDSNSYFRLAKSIHPLLFRPFGDDDACLYVTKELDDEFNRSPRLQAKFPWVDEPEFRDNRSQRLKLSKRQRNTELPTANEFLRDHARDEGLGLSWIDLTILAHGYALGIPVVTDDGDMCALAEAFGIQILSTLELLRRMVDAKHVNMAKIRQIVGFWAYEKDLPRNFAVDYRRLFDESPPA